MNNLLKQKLDKNPHINLWLILDNIRSAYNVGAIFRTADGTGTTGMILLGITPTPDNQLSKVHKTALGSEQSVPYLYYEKTDDFLREIKELKLDSRLGALELTDRAVNLFEWSIDKDQIPYFIAVGHELLGVSSKILVNSEFHLAIPMNGYKESLNVGESSSILIYEFWRKLNISNC